MNLSFVVWVAVPWRTSSPNEVAYFSLTENFEWRTCELYRSSKPNMIYEHLFGHNSFVERW
jgi:hypothetical protein